MQSVEITRSTIAAGRRVNVGEIVELSDADALSLINMGKAAPVAESPKVENREDDVRRKTSKRAATKDKAKA
jgi:hypothetical protein